MGAGPARLSKSALPFKPNRGFPIPLNGLGGYAGRAMPFTDDDLHFMKEALAFARIAFSEQEVPFGAAGVREGTMVGRGLYRPGHLADPTHHAEIEAIREAAQARGNWRLDGATLYATVEPCPMCAGAAVNARISRVVYGCSDPKAG